MAVLETKPRRYGRHPRTCGRSARCRNPEGREFLGKMQAKDKTSAQTDLLEFGRESARRLIVDPFRFEHVLEHFGTLNSLDSRRLM